MLRKKSFLSLSPFSLSLKLIQIIPVNLFIYHAPSPTQPVNPLRMQLSGAVVVSFVRDSDCLCAITAFIWCLQPICFFAFFLRCCHNGLSLIVMGMFPCSGQRIYSVLMSWSNCFGCVACKMMAIFSLGLYYFYFYVDLASVSDTKFWYHCSKCLYLLLLGRVQ